MNQPALIITGPQGCGKTILAEHIASMISESVDVIDARDLEWMFNGWANSDVVIVEECDFSDDIFMAKACEYVTAHRIAVREVGMPLTDKLAPIFIFTTNASIPRHPELRRFMVVHLDGVDVVREG